MYSPYKTEDYAERLLVGRYSKHFSLQCVLPDLQPSRDTSRIEVSRGFMAVRLNYYRDNATNGIVTLRCHETCQNDRSS